MATLARWARSFGLTRAICILLLLALVPLRIVNPPPLEEVRLRTFDLYQSLRPRETVLRPDVAEQILAAREAGVPLKSQAILFRASHHSAQLEIELSRRSIPFVKYGGL